MPLRPQLASLFGALILMVSVQAPSAVAAEGPGPLIVGGHEASENYSFMASLRRNGSFTCGASLIEPRWVVTAAHCVAGLPVALYTVRVGSNDRSIGGTESRVTQVIVHPDYTGGSPGGDLALLELDRRVGYQPIEIAADPGPPGTATRILGWGMTCDAAQGQPCSPSDIPTELQELDTKLVADGRCGNFDADTELCTDSDTPGAQACSGDSGGPQIKGRPGQWELIGATSRDGDNDPVCSTGTGIWTDVTAYADWIERNTG